MTIFSDDPQEQEAWMEKRLYYSRSSSLYADKINKLV